MNPLLIEKYIPFVDKISSEYQYNSNISHLLYLIIPAFVTKYSIYKEKLILNTFQNIRIIISKETSQTIEAYYTSIPNYQNNTIKTNKFIVIQNYEKITLVQLLDNLVHEFNHAMNSYEKEILIKENTLYLRTGLTYATYTIPDLTPIKKDDSYVLEEILNTNQTEEIINIIKSYQDPNNSSINTTIYSLNNETDEKYTSNAYYLENTLLKPILENKTFLSTLNNLRITGDIENIEDWFNNITGIKNSYQKLIQYLNEIINLEQTLITKKFFKNRIIRKIKDLFDKVLEIITIFNKNCNYR